MLNTLIDRKDLFKKDFVFGFPRRTIASAVCYVWSEKTALGIWLAHPIIWNPVIVIIRVTFITQAIFVMILLARVGKIGAVVLEKIKGAL